MKPSKKKQATAKKSSHLWEGKLVLSYIPQRLKNSSIKLYSHNNRYSGVFPLWEHICHSKWKVINLCAEYIARGGHQEDVTCWFDPLAGPRQLEVPPPSPVHGICTLLAFPVSPALEAAQGHVQTVMWCWDHLDWAHDWTLLSLPVYVTDPIKPLYKLLRFGGWVGGKNYSSCDHPRQASSVSSLVY